MSLFLVTGAAGFIGSHLVDRLLRDGHTVRGIDNFATGRRDNIACALQLGLEFFEGDINDVGLIDRAMTGVDYVLHEAAVPSVPRSLEAPMVSHEANATGTLSVLEAARRAGCVKRLVYAASSSAYGNTPVLPKVESMAPNPRSPYAVAKLAGEQYCRSYAGVFGLPCVCLRYFNVFGPRQDPASRYAAVIPRFIECMLKGEQPPVHGDGRQSRDFTYVGNVVQANLAACASDRGSGEVVNIACGDRIDLLGVVSELNRLLGTSIQPRFLPARAGDIRDSLADISKARELLGYNPKTTFAEGLALTLESFGQARENGAAS